MTNSSITKIINAPLIGNEGQKTIHKSIFNHESLKIAIIGSRKTGLDIVKFTDILDGLLSGHNDYVIISGGAMGIDTLAALYCKDKGIEIKVIKPDYNKHGRGAPLKRNDEIIKISDWIIAFWDGKSTGTNYIIKQAPKYKKPVRIIYEGNI